MLPTRQRLVFHGFHDYRSFQLELSNNASSIEKVVIKIINELISSDVSHSLNSISSSPNITSSLFHFPAIHSHFQSQLLSTRSCHSTIRFIQLRRRNHERIKSRTTVVKYLVPLASSLGSTNSLCSSKLPMETITTKRLKQ